MEKTRLEYNNARQAVGVAHKAAVKLAAKKDAIKIDENPGVVKAEALLIGASSLSTHTSNLKSDAWQYNAKC